MEFLTTRKVCFLHISLISLVDVTMLQKNHDSKGMKNHEKNMFHLSPAIECEVVMQRREDKHEIIMLDSGVPSRELLLGPSPRVNRVKHCFNLS